MRQLAGEPDLEKTQMAAHEQMELLKSAQKEIVSAANVAGPASFVKPLDFSVDLLVRTHPTLREYCKQVSCAEVDAEAALHPLKKERVMPKDEVELKNAKTEDDASFVKTLSKSISGAFINTAEVPTYDLPGNFGVRVIETMPTDLRNVCVDQRNNLPLGYTCDSRPAHIPALLEAPDHNDYLTDEESDEAADFEVKVPELDKLLGQFENDDEVILGLNEVQKTYAKDLISKGFQPEVRYDIKDNKGEKAALLDENISKQREL